jgi:Tetratrico peptide repeat
MKQSGEERLSHAWASIDQRSEAEFVAVVEQLTSELPPDNAIEVFERASALDSTGHPNTAAPLYRQALKSLPKRSALILRKTPIPITKTGVFLEINRMSGTAAAASPALSTIRVQVLRRRAEQTVQRVGLRVTVTAAHAGRRQRRSSTMSISVALDSTLCNPHSKLCIGD